MNAHLISQSNTATANGTSHVPVVMVDVPVGYKGPAIVIVEVDGDARFYQRRAGEIDNTSGTPVFEQGAGARDFFEFSTFDDAPEVLLDEGGAAFGPAVLAPDGAALWGCVFCITGD